jgi:ankyrin repeat protein
VNKLPDNHPYFQACEDADHAALQSFWKQGVSVYASGETKLDALGIAFQSRNYALMKFILEQGYSIDHICDAFGGRILYHAIQTGDEHLVHFILAYGPDVNAPDNHGYTPLLSAIGSGRISLVHILEKAGANFKIKTKQGVTN